MTTSKLPKNQKHYTKTLPLEIWGNILSRLDAKSLVQFHHTSKRFNDLNHIIDKLEHEAFTKKHLGHPIAGNATTVVRTTGETSKTRNTLETRLDDFLAKKDAFGRSKNYASPNRQWLIAKHPENKIFRIQKITTSWLKIDLHLVNVVDFVFSPDSSWLAVILAEPIGDVLFFNLKHNQLNSPLRFSLNKKTATCLNAANNSCKDIPSIQFSENGQYFVALTYDRKQLRVLDFKQAVQKSVYYDREIVNLTVSRDSQFLVATLISLGEEKLNKVIKLDLISTFQVNNLDNKIVNPFQLPSSQNNSSPANKTTVRQALITLNIDKNFDKKRCLLPETFENFSPRNDPFQLFNNDANVSPDCQWQVKHCPKKHLFTIKKMSTGWPTRTLSAVNVVDFVFSPDSSWLAFVLAEPTGDVLFFNLKQDQLESPLKFSLNKKIATSLNATDDLWKDVSNIQFSQNGQYFVALTCDKKELLVIDFKQNIQKSVNYDCYRGTIISPTVSPDSRFLAATLASTEEKPNRLIWLDLTSNFQVNNVDNEIQKLGELDTAAINDIENRFSADGQWLVCKGECYIFLYKIDKEKNYALVLKTQFDDEASFYLSNNGKWFIAKEEKIDNHQLIQLGEKPVAKLAFSYEEHAESKQFCFSPNDEWLVVITDYENGANDLSFWHLNQEIPKLEKYFPIVPAIRRNSKGRNIFSPDSKRLAIIMGNGESVCLINLQNLQPIWQQFKFNESTVSFVKFSQDNSKFFIHLANNRTCMYDFLN